MFLRFRHRLMQVSVVVSILAGSWALAVLLTGGLAFQLGSLHLSSRHALNPAILAVLSAVAAFKLATRDERRHDWPSLVSSTIAIGAAAAVVSFGLSKGLFVAAASDAYGYVSQADLLGSRRRDCPATLGARDDMA